MPAILNISGLPRYARNDEGGFEIRCGKDEKTLALFYYLRYN
jgi:hypothetical protein